MELKKIKDNLIEKDELETAKTKLLSNQSFSLESTLSLVRRFFKKYIVTGKVLSFKESTDAIKKVTSKQVQKCAKKIFKRRILLLLYLDLPQLQKRL